MAQRRGVRTYLRKETAKTNQHRLRVGWQARHKRQQPGCAWEEKEHINRRRHGVSSGRAWRWRKSTPGGITFDPKSGACLAAGKGRAPHRHGRNGSREYRQTSLYGDARRARITYGCAAKANKYQTRLPP